MAENITPTLLFFALLGGILPAIFWLWFWLKEDKLHPEPRSLIILAFLVGMLATAAAYPIEKFIAEHVHGSDLTLLLLWAVTEEALKFLGIYIVALRSKYFDEPIDAVIYFMTIALGFSALENAMFLINPLSGGDTMTAFMLGNFRFIGATLLHVAASGLIGVLLALAFYQPQRIRRFIGGLGLLSAVVLHTLFNFSIIISEGSYIYEIFIALWVFVVGLLLACERIKRMPPRSHVEYAHTGTIFLPHNIA
jgi:protease PrsW